MAWFGIDLSASGIDFSLAGIVDIYHFFEGPSYALPIWVQVAPQEKPTRSFR
jgi:hypothetical protein